MLNSVVIRLVKMLTNLTLAVNPTLKCEDVSQNLTVLKFMLAMILICICCLKWALPKMELRSTLPAALTGWPSCVLVGG